jgi:hypothetical protein
MSVGLQARVYDPLWMLARQWQLGELAGEDAGSPASASWQAEAAPISRFAPGVPTAAAPVAGRPFDGRATPLEVVAERERVRPVPGATTIEKLRFAADAGQHLVRMIAAQATSRSYRELLTVKFPFPPLAPAERAALDADSGAFVDLVLPRVPDGRALYAAFAASLRPPPPAVPALPAGLAFVAADVAEAMVAAQAWLVWYETLVSEPAAADGAAAPVAWVPERMEHAFAVAARASTGEKVLAVQEHASGRAEWYDFNLVDGASLGAMSDALPATVNRAAIPAPVTYRGMPAVRFWEMEDATVDFGAVDAGPEDLARLLLVDFALTYGNDWFVIPIDLDVGAIYRTGQLVVTNTFGERFLIRSSNDAGALSATFRMFQLSSSSTSASTSASAPGAAAVSDPSLFLLPPVLMAGVEGRAVEDVMFLRDEMANVAWAVERVIESATERALDRHEQQRPPPAPPPPSDAGLTYRLASEVPDNWVPLIPVMGADGLRLRRGAVLEIAAGPAGAPAVVRARGKILNPAPGTATGVAGGLAIRDHEIPREGIRVTRGYQLARWVDGSTHLWLGRRKRIGRGEGSSALRFDSTGR